MRFIISFFIFTIEKDINILEFAPPPPLRRMHCVRRTFACMCVCTCVCAYVRVCVRAYVCACVRVRVCVRAYELVSLVDELNVLVMRTGPSRYELNTSVSLPSSHRHQHQHSLRACEKSRIFTSNVLDMCEYSRVCFKRIFSSERA